MREIKDEMTMPKSKDFIKRYNVDIVQRCKKNDYRKLPQGVVEIAFITAKDIECHIVDRCGDDDTETECRDKDLKRGIVRVDLGIRRKEIVIGNQDEE